MPEPVKKSPTKAPRKSRRERAKVTADWATVDAETIGRFVQEMMGENRAVRLGYTRDSGAYAIGVYGNDAPYTEYIRPQGDVVAELEEILLDATGKDRVLGDRA